MRLVSRECVEACRENPRVRVEVRVRVELDVSVELEVVMESALEFNNGIDR